MQSVRSFSFSLLNMEILGRSCVRRRRDCNTCARCRLTVSYLGQSSLSRQQHKITYFVVFLFFFFFFFFFGYCLFCFVVFNLMITFSLRNNLRKWIYKLFDGFILLSKYFLTRYLTSIRVGLFHILMHAVFARLCFLGLFRKSFNIIV